jgi:23S rRNA (cytidine1920-2'-O)/16S rRNA (cytidine1409-2'-O)-methyltransferase
LASNPSDEGGKQVGRKGRARLRKLRDELQRVHPSNINADAAIARGEVIVDGRIVSNPASLVRQDAAITLRVPKALRGEGKLRAALHCFPIDIDNRVALDVGAAAGGFTRVLLEAGARRVYAVDAGHGQLVGSLRQDPRVANLEATNLGALNLELVPDVIEIITIDLSYLALSDAVPQLETIRIAKNAHAVALVKPQFELALAEPPADRAQLARALRKARDGFVSHGWLVPDWIESPLLGRHGSVEFLLHAEKSG